MTTAEQLPAQADGAENPRRPRAARPSTPLPRQLALLVLLAATVPAQLYLAIPVAESVRQDFGTGTAAAAWTGSAFSFAYAVGFLLFGPLSDRFGRRPVLVLGALATAATTAAVSLAPDFGWLLALRVLQGLAASTFAPVALAYVAENAPAARRPVMLSFVTTGLLGSGLVGQVFGQAVVDHASWRAAFWPAAIVYALGALGLWRLLAPPRPNPAATLPGVLRAAGRLLRDPAALAVFAAALTVFGSFVALYAVLNQHLTDDRGFGTSGILAVQALGAIGLAASPLVNRLAGGQGPSRLGVAGFLTAATGLALAQAEPLPLLVLGTVVYVAGISLVVPALVGLLHRIAPQSGGAAVSFNTFVLFVGASVGEIAAAHTGYRTMLTVLCAALLLAAASVYSTGRRTNAG